MLKREFYGIIGSGRGSLNSDENDNYCIYVLKLHLYFIIRMKSFF